MGVRAYEHNGKMGGNLGPGWVQFRKQILGEYIAD